MTRAEEILDLIESKNRLHHATDFPGALRILRSNKFMSQEETGVSFSRESSYWHNWRLLPIRFIVDERTLRYNYKLEPYNYYGDLVSRTKRDFEFESVVRRNIDNAMRYILAIEIHAKGLDPREVSIIQKLAKNKPVNVIGEFPSRYNPNVHYDRDTSAEMDNTILPTASGYRFGRGL